MGSNLKVFVIILAPSNLEIFLELTNSDDEETSL